MKIHKLPTVAGTQAGFIQVLGVQNLMRKLGKLRPAVGGGFVRGGKRAANLLLIKADYFVPTDTKELRESGAVRAIGAGLATEYAIQYTADHATVVHEDLDAAHGARFNTKYAAQIKAGKTHMRRPQEQAKWLEHASRINREAMRKEFRIEIKKAIRKAVAG